jgi:hypothetical protein
MLCAWKMAATPRNVIGSFRGAEIIVRWDETRESLVSEVALEASDRGHGVFLHEILEQETEDELVSHDDSHALMLEVD